MPLLTAAVTMIGLLCIVNLVLLYATVHRLHGHTELLARLLDARPVPRSVLPPGQRPGRFQATTLEGEQVAGQDLALVGFLTQDCRRCQERLPLFVQAAEAMPGGRRRVLAVVVAGPEIAHSGNPASSHLAKLGEIAQVVVEPRDGPIAAAFKVVGFPSFCRLGPDGLVVANGDAALTAA